MHKEHYSLQYATGSNITDERTSKTRHQFNFECVDAAFKTLGFSEEMIFTIYKVLSSILHLGNITFDENDRNDCELNNGSRKWLSSAAELLGVDENIIEQSLLYRHLTLKDNIR